MESFSVLFILIGRLNSAHSKYCIDSIAMIRFNGFIKIGKLALKNVDSILRLAIQIVQYDFCSCPWNWRIFSSSFGILDVYLFTCGSFVIRLFLTTFRVDGIFALGSLCDKHAQQKFRACKLWLFLYDVCVLVRVLKLNQSSWANTMGDWFRNRFTIVQNKWQINKTVLDNTQCMKCTTIQKKSVTFIVAITVLDIWFANQNVLAKLNRMVFNWRRKTDDESHTKTHTWA